MGLKFRSLYEILGDKIDWKEDSYKCINYDVSKDNCKLCDGFGRNLNNEINVIECYNSSRYGFDEDSIDLTIKLAGMIY